MANEIKNEYIDKGELYDTVWDFCEGKKKVNFLHILNLIDKAPAADVVEVKHDACPFCEKYDFSRSKIEVDEDGANIALAICNTKFTKEEQFKYCPACGKKL